MLEMVLIALMSKAEAKQVCLTDANLSGRKQLTSNFHDKKFVQFSDDFKKFCDGNIAKIECKAIEVKTSNARAEELKLVGDKNCAQAMSVPSGENSVVYFYNQK